MFMKSLEADGVIRVICVIYSFMTLTTFKAEMP